MEENDAEKIEPSQKLLFLLMSLSLIVVLLITMFLYSSERHRRKELQRQVGTLAKNDCTSHELQIESYRSQLQDIQKTNSQKETRKNISINTVEKFIYEYYESEFRDSYTKVSWVSNYLGDYAIRQLSPYINSPDEITFETIEKIRNHDAEIVTLDISNFHNIVHNLELYYEEKNEHNSTVFCYFILETSRKGSSSKSPYLLRCNVLTVDDGYVIDEISLRTPVVLPAYDPDTMILE